MNGTFSVLTTFLWDWKLFRKLRVKSKAYRDAYVRERIRIGIPYQIRALREQEGRNWTQAELGRRAGKPQNVISRLEDPEYGKLSIQTLLEMASAFDVALMVKFVPFSRFLREFDDVSPASLEAESFENEVQQFDAGAFGTPASVYTGLWYNLEDSQAVGVATSITVTNCGSTPIDTRTAGEVMGQQNLALAA